MSTNAILGHGTTVRIGRGSTPTWTALPGIETITFPEQVASDVDTTNLGSPGKTEESIPGLLPATDWKATMFYVPASAADVALAACLASGEYIILEITPNQGVAHQWTAYVKGYVPTMPTKDKMTVEITLRVMAAIEE